MAQPAMPCYIAKLNAPLAFRGDRVKTDGAVIMAVYRKHIHGRATFGFGAMLVFLLCALALLAPVSAQAQFSDGYKFLKAVKDADGVEVEKFINEPGSTIVNVKEQASGEAALHIVVARRDARWLSYLLSHSANPDIADNRGTTPLMMATQLRWIEGVVTLLAGRASVDKPNGQGETPLIRAVQLRDLELVRLLISKGANPNRPDTLAGMSARDYAVRDGRTPGLIEALDQAKATPPKAAVQGPSL